jgi:hypothetical protein
MHGSVFTFGRFLARSMMATSVPMTGPSTDMSAKMAAAWLTVLVAMVGGGVGYRLNRASSLVDEGSVGGAEVPRDEFR